MKMKRKPGRVLCTIMLVFAVLCPSVFAMAADAKGSITVSFDYPTTFSLYHVADYNGDGTYTLVGEFAELSESDEWPVDLTSESAASTLENYVYAGINPDEVEDTDENGNVTFTGLSEGAYLIMGDEVATEDNQIYAPVATLLSLPGWNEDGTANWSKEVEVKKEIYEGFARAMRFYCAFDFNPVVDDDFPEELDVDVYKEEELYTTVTIREEEDWEFHLEDVEEEEFAKDTWSVEPEVPEGYTVEVEKHLDTKKNLIFKIYYNKKEEGTPTGEKTTNTGKTVKNVLPRTGQNWTLVSGLAGSGMVFLIAGTLRYRKNDEEA